MSRVMSRHVWPGCIHQTSDLMQLVKEWCRLTSWYWDTVKPQNTLKLGKTRDEREYISVYPCGLVSVRVTNPCRVVIFIFPHVNNPAGLNKAGRAGWADRSVGSLHSQWPVCAVFIIHPHPVTATNNTGASQTSELWVLWASQAIGHWSRGAKLRIWHRVGFRADKDNGDYSRPVAVASARLQACWTPW